MPIKRENEILNPISCGITWVHGGIIFNDITKWSKFYYGICHYRDLSKNVYPSVFFFTPEDFEKPTTAMIEIIVDPNMKYCDFCHHCINLHCEFNRFDMDVFMKQFEDMGRETMGLPRDFGRNEEKKEEYNWFNVGRWKPFWSKFVDRIGIEGGVIRYDRKKYYEKGD